jgi:hypothetical protein
MGDFSDLNQEEQALLISLPYRVGVWVSNVDDIEQTKRDDKREMKALEIVIARLAKSHRKMPFAASIMAAIQQNQSVWKAWNNNASENVVLGDVQNSLFLCHQKLSVSQLKQYKHAIWQIAVVVAQAYGEQEDPDNEMHVDHFFQWIGGFIIAPSLKKAPENMSAKEKTALKKLRAILKEQ